MMNILLRKEKQRLKKRKYKKKKQAGQKQYKPNIIVAGA